MMLRTFRTDVLAALQAARRQSPDAGLHLVYAPELADPLALAQDSRRDRAPLLPLLGLQRTGPDEARPCVVTFDVRRIGPHLLEHDAGFDDPLLEASVAEAQAALFLNGGADATLTNDMPGLAENAVCGWVVSPETAAQVAGRINRHAAPARASASSSASAPGLDRPWLQWHLPGYLSALWPTLDAVQRRALLGPGTWLVPTVTGRLECFAAEPAGESPNAEAGNALPRISLAQAAAVDDVPLVNQLMRQWNDQLARQGLRLPDDAAPQLHAHVRWARDRKLDGGELALFVMVGVQLRPGAADAPEFQQMLHRTLGRGASLRDGLAELPETFWARHALEQPGAAEGPIDPAGPGALTRPEQRAIRRYGASTGVSRLFMSTDPCGF